MDTKNKDKQSINNQNISCKEGKTLNRTFIELQTFKEYLTLMSFQNYLSGTLLLL